MQNTKTTMTWQKPAEFWDQRYGEPGKSFGTQPNAFLASQAGFFRTGQHVLVPGDGEGRNGVWLAQQGLVVDTVDASSNGAANARALAAKRGVALNAVAADLTEWPWPVAHYDAVVSIFLHLPQAIRAGLHAKMLAALKPGGVIVLEAYATGQLHHQKAGTVGGPQNLDGLFSAEILRADFSAAEIVSLGEVETTIDEGTRHRGPSSVVRLIARRRGGEVQV